MGGDKKLVEAFKLWCYRSPLRVSWVEMKTNKWVMDKRLYVEKEYGREEDEVLWSYCPKNSMERKVESGEGADMKRPGAKTILY